MSYEMHDEQVIVNKVDHVAKDTNKRKYLDGDEKLTTEALSNLGVLL